MTDVEIAQLAALKRCRFSPGSAAKNFVGRVGDFNTEYELSPKQTAFLDRLAHQYRKQIGKCMAVACLPCNPVIDAAVVRVALDAFIEQRAVEEFDPSLPMWRKVALARYNEELGL